MRIVIRTGGQTGVDRAALDCALRRGFRYGGSERRVVAAPRGAAPFRSFWSAGPGWGTFALSPRRFSLAVAEGSLPVRRVEFTGAAQPWRTAAPHDISRQGDRVVVTFRDEISVAPGKELVIEA